MVSLSTTSSTSSRNSSLSARVAPPRRSFIRSESRKSTKNTIVKPTPVTVATFLVRRFMDETANRAIVIATSPSGSSARPSRMLRGTFHSRGAGSL